jgi:hypothetical protein
MDPVNSTATTNNADNNLLDIGIDLMGGGAAP